MNLKYFKWENIDQRIVMTNGVPNNGYGLFPFHSLFCVIFYEDKKVTKN